MDGIDLLRKSRSSALQNALPLTDFMNSNGYLKDIGGTWWSRFSRQ